MCQHSKHASYRLPVVQDVDCKGCPLKVATDSAGDPMLPGMFEQAKHLAGDLSAAHADGYQPASDRCINERELVCMGCPMLTKSRKRCTACGCNLLFKRKLRAWTCDLGYWDHIPTNIQAGDQLPTPEKTPAELKRE